MMMTCSRGGGRGGRGGGVLSESLSTLVPSTYTMGQQYSILECIAHIQSQFVVVVENL